MKSQNFKTLNFQDQQMGRFQDNIGAALSVLIQSPLAKISTVTVKLASGDNTVNHLLGATPLLWIVCDKQAAGDVYRKSWNDQSIVLNASAPMTVSIVFG